MNIESHARVCASFRLAFPGAEPPPYAAVRDLDETVVKRAIGIVKAKPMTKFYARDLVAGLVLREVGKKPSKRGRGCKGKIRQ